jgi:two-component system sensor histidine kinase UhpB
MMPAAARRTAMSLKLRLVLSIAIGFVLALLSGGSLAMWQARQSVRTEMRAALEAGADIAADESTARPSDLERMVRSLNGLRHLRATLKDGSGRTVAAAVPAQSANQAPPWFERPIAPAPSLLRLTAPPLPTGWVLTLTTDPRNEIAEVWGQTRDAFAAMIVFCLSAGALVYLLAIRSLGFLADFGQALGRVGDGHYDVAVRESGPPEFARLARGYNQMAIRLSQYERETDRLQRHIQKVQDEERAEIARDLHDEVGPFVFSINVDAAAIGELAAARSLADAKERADRIGEAAGHIQQRVKSILRQLRPIDVLDFGLEVAIRELFSFWQARTPELHLTFRNALAETALTRAQEEVVYRVVQESLSNAVRHGRPDSITVCMATNGENSLVVSIEDDGCGLPSPAFVRGTGLTGMAERLRSVEGTLMVENRETGSGARVTAVLPFATDPEPGAEETT